MIFRKRPNCEVAKKTQADKGGSNRSPGARTCQDHVHDGKVAIGALYSKAVELDASQVGHASHILALLATCATVEHIGGNDVKRMRFSSQSEQQSKHIRSHMLA